MPNLLEIFRPYFQNGLFVFICIFRYSLVDMVNLAKLIQNLEKIFIFIVTPKSIFVQFEII